MHYADDEVCTVQTALLYREVRPPELIILLLRPDRPYFGRKFVIHSFGVKGLVLENVNSTSGGAAPLYLIFYFSGWPEDRIGKLACKCN